MAFDYAALSALAQTNNWDAIRQGKARELQFAALQNQLAEKQLQQEQQSADEIQQYMDVAGKLKVMRPDLEKIRDANEKLKQPIKEGILAANGDVKKWYNSGGRNELAKYRNSLLETPEVQTGLMNTLQHQRYLADQQAGLNPLDVTYQGEDGQPTQGNYLQQFNQYANGKLDRLNYNGGYKRPDVNPQEYFGKMLPPEGSPYEKQAVSLPELQRYLYSNSKGGGLSEPQRKQFVKDYTNEYLQSGAKGASPYTYKQEDIEKVRHARVMEDLSKARFDLQVRKLHATLSESADPYDDLFGKMELGNPVKQPVDANSYAEQFGLPANQPAGTQTEVISSMKPITSQTYKTNVADILGLKYDKKAGGYVGKIANGDKIVSYNNLMPAPGNLNDIEHTIKDIQGIVTIPSPDGKAKKSYAVINVASTAGQFDKLGVYNQHWLLPNSNTAFSQGRTEGDPLFGGKTDMTMLVPIPTDEFTKRGFNYKMRNTDNPKYASQFSGDEFLNESVTTDEE